MGLKPLNENHLFNPFTKVNGNEKHQTLFYQLLLPSALADGYYITMNDKALATIFSNIPYLR